MTNARIATPLVTSLMVLVAGLAGIGYAGAWIVLAPDQAATLPPPPSAQAQLLWL